MGSGVGCFIYTRKELDADWGKASCLYTDQVKSNKHVLFYDGMFVIVGVWSRWAKERNSLVVGYARRIL